MLLHDCANKNALEIELLILGPKVLYQAAIEGRDRMRQAVLGIAEAISCGSGISEMLQNEACQSIIAALGVGVQLDPDIPLNLQSLRCGRLIVGTDQSPAGCQIQGEVLRFLLTYMRQVLESGCVYVLDPVLEIGWDQGEFENQVLRPDKRQIRVVTPAEALDTTLGDLS